MLQIMETVGRRIGGPTTLAMVFAPDTGDMPASGGREAKVLIVEDDHLVAIEAEAALSDAGFEIAGIAATAEEAITLARSTNPDVVVMDIRLAGKRDGIEAALQLVAETGLRSIFASAHNDSATRMRGAAARPVGWLAKPYPPDALVRAVKEAVSQLKS